MNFKQTRIRSSPSVEFSTKNENTNFLFIKQLQQFKKYNFYPNPEIGARFLTEIINTSKEHIILGMGSESLLKDLFLVLKYSSIQIIEHSYEIVEYYNKLLDKNVIFNPVVFNNNNFNCKDVVSVGGDLLYLVNPHCPTGITFNLKQITSFSEAFKYVIVDEAYTNPLKHNWPVFDNVVFVKTFSKLGGVPGLRLGYAVGPANIIHKLNCIRDCYEITNDSNDYLQFICSNTELIDQNITELQECYNILRSKQLGFSIQCGNFALFKGNNFLGKKYKIDNNPFTRVTLTDRHNYENLYCR